MRALSQDLHLPRARRLLQVCDDRTGGPALRILIVTDAWLPQINGVVRVLSSLRLVGLDEDARALAIEAAIAGDL